MGGSGNVNDPVYVIRCDKTYSHGFNEVEKAIEYMRCKVKNLN